MNGFSRKASRQANLKRPTRQRKNKTSTLTPLQPFSFSLPPSLDSYLLTPPPSLHTTSVQTDQQQVENTGKVKKNVGLKSVLRFFGFNVCPYVVEEKLPIWLNSPQHKKKRSTNSLGSSGCVRLPVRWGCCWGEYKLFKFINRILLPICVQMPRWGIVWELVRVYFLILKCAVEHQILQPISQSKSLNMWITGVDMRNWYRLRCQLTDLTRIIRIMTG